MDSTFGGCMKRLAGTLWILENSVFQVYKMARWRSFRWCRLWKFNDRPGFHKSSPKCKWRCKKGRPKAVGHTKGSINTKIHAVVDALGNPIKFILSEGQRRDSKFLIPLLRELKINNCSVLADRTYDTDEIIKYINTNNANVVIPPKSNRKIKRKMAVLKEDRGKIVLEAK